MTELFVSLWLLLLGLLDVSISLLASAHVVLFKRDARAAVAWVGLIWLVPFLGALLYVGLGINRIRRRAQELRPEHAAEFHAAEAEVPPSECGALAPLARMIDQVTELPLTRGNRVEVLVNGAGAYPVMLHAIEHARSSVHLSSYIFDYDHAGTRFLNALQGAKERGVETRVLIDDVGARYRWPGMAAQLEKAGIEVARFLPSFVPWRFRYANLRNHRKILVVDGSIGFTGGMNIREGNLMEGSVKQHVQDTHFRIEGPIVAQLEDVFLTDWSFARGEPHEAPRPPPTGGSEGVLCRGIVDGPDENLDKLRWTLLGALVSARSSILVMTPYFLPDASLITALNLAAMRGVKVDIVLPAENNLKLVQWASTALFWQLLERGCRIWLSPPPFDHSKLLIIDRCWSLVGSANWDPRSLRLNFEFDVECYDQRLATELSGLAEEKIRRSEEVSLAHVDGRSLPVRLRDGIARLLTPYL